MKKRTLFFYILSSFLVVLLMSCKVDMVDTSLLVKPDIDTSTKHVTLIVHKISNDTAYINIYRQKVDSSSSEEEPIYNIGIIYPKAIDNGEQTYRFIDELVYVNTSYRYRARYFDTDGYHYTDWSNTIKVDEDFESAYEQNKSLAYKTTSNVTFTFDETDYTLTLTGALIMPDITSFDENFHPMLIVNNGISTQVFKISPETLTDRQPITLKDRLPLEFLDRNIVIQGVLAQQYDYLNPDAEESELIIKTIHWTTPTNLKVSGYSDNIIKVPSVLATKGFDYTSNVRKQ